MFGGRGQLMQTTFGRQPEVGCQLKESHMVSENAGRIAAWAMG